MNHDIKFLDSLVGGQLIVRGYCRHCSLSVKHMTLQADVENMVLNPFALSRREVTLGMNAMSCTGPGTHQDNIVREGDRWCYDYPSESGSSTRTLVVKNIHIAYADVQAEAEGSLLMLRALQLDKAGCPANLRKREGEMYKWYRASA